MNIEWVAVAGGTCLFGDHARPVTVPALLWTRTPVTRGQYGEDTGPYRGHPMTGIDQSTAECAARRLGGRLPRSVEWEWMAAGSARRRWPWGDQPWRAELANLRDSGPARTTEVAAHRPGATPDGLLDVAGNVWEWTASRVLGEGFVIRGGSYASPPLYAQCTFLNAAPSELRSPGIGFRVVREP